MCSSFVNPVVPICPGDPLAQPEWDSQVTPPIPNLLMLPMGCPPNPSGSPQPPEQPPTPPLRPESGPSVQIQLPLLFCRSYNKGCHCRAQLWTLVLSDSTGGQGHISGSWVSICP